MKKKLIKYSLVALAAFLPLPFIMEWSYFFGGGYICIAVMICGAAWGQLNKNITGGE